LNNEAEFKDEGWAGDVACPGEHIMYLPVLDQVMSLQSDVENGKLIGWYEDVLEYYGLHPVEIDRLEVTDAALEPAFRERIRTDDKVVISSNARRTHEDSVVGMQLHFRVDTDEPRWARYGLKLPPDGEIGPAALDDGHVRRVVLPGEQEPDVRVFPVGEVPGAAAAAIVVFPPCPTIPAPDMRVFQGAGRHGVNGGGSIEDDRERDQRPTGDQLVDPLPVLRRFPISFRRFAGLLIVRRR
jgi:hypothetical protein